MTTGEYLVAHSSLPSGTALAHLLALNAGSGTGETVFASRFSVTTGEDRFSVVRKAKRQAPKPEVAPRQVKQPSHANDKGLFAVARTQGVTVSSQADSITVIQKTQCQVATTDLGNLTVNRKRKST